MRRLLFSAILLLAVLLAAQWAQAKPARFKYSPEFILSEVLKMKNLKPDPSKTLPTLHLESETSLKEFQDAIESQWNLRPDAITNAYAIKTNQIFIMDDENYYSKTGRCMDDSLAHEYVHYVQHIYQGLDLYDDSVEWEAVDLQTRFREVYCQ